MSFVWLSQAGFWEKFVTSITSHASSRVFVPENINAPSDFRVVSFVLTSLHTIRSTERAVATLVTWTF